MGIGRWIYAEFTKITGIFTSVILAIRHGPEVFDTIKSWFGFAQEIERRIGDRRTHMSVLTIINGVELAAKDAEVLSTFMANLPTYLPAIEKQLADLKQAQTDEKNPVALAADVTTILTDLSQDLATVVPMITNLLPVLKAPATPATAPTPPVA